MDRANDSEATLRLQAEKLVTRTSSVPDRDVSVARDVVETNVRLDVTLLAEGVRIAEGPVTQRYADVPVIGEPQRLVVRLSRERAHLAIRVFEYERVAVGTRKATDTARISASLRHEELAIDRSEGQLP